MRLLTSICLITSLTTGAAVVISNEPAREAADFVLDSLREINDSGIYNESLRLHSIQNAEIVDGLYHTNTLLKLELASEHFESGNPTELFDVIVMESKPADDEDGEDHTQRRGYAIDRFPKMKDEAIEESLRKKIEGTRRNNRRVREEVLRWE